jgi:hypothetical protein
LFSFFRHAEVAVARKGGRGNARDLPIRSELPEGLNAWSGDEPRIRLSKEKRRRFSETKPGSIVLSFWKVRTNKPAATSK